VTETWPTAGVAAANGQHGRDAPVGDVHIK